MKKIFTAILVLIYFTVSTGFVVSLHYCMDKLASTELGAKADKTCNKCGMETDGSCCWDDVKVVKMEVDHTVAQAYVAHFSAPSILSVTQHLIIESLVSNLSIQKILYQHPPPYGQDTYLQNRVFRC